MLLKLKSKVLVCLGTEWLPSIDQPFDRIHQFVYPEWFPEVSNACLSQESLCLGAYDVSGQKKKPVTEVGIQGPHKPVQLLAAHTRHPLIADDHIVVLLFN